MQQRPAKQLEIITLIINYQIFFFIPFQLVGIHRCTLKTQNPVLIMSYTAVK